MEAKTAIQSSMFDEALLDGMPNCWHAILPSDELKEKPVGVRRLEKDLVLWRDRSGTAHLFPDFCPHRGSALSQGDVVDGNLACWYHGIQYDGDGVCREVPASIKSALIGKLKIQKYRLEERCGMLWAYFGDEERYPAPPLTLAVYDGDAASADHVIYQLEKAAENSDFEPAFTISKTLNIMQSFTHYSPGKRQS